MADNRPIVTNLDFEDIKADMINYFKGREEFKDYEFTGSGLNMLMDILAYNTHYNSLAANFLVNEMFLDTAVMRDNVVSIAKSLNYVPRSAQAAVATLRLKINRPIVEGVQQEYYRLPANTVFTSSVDNQTLTFYTIQDYVVQFETDDTFQYVDVEVYEGNTVTQRFIAAENDTNFSSFELLNRNIDTRTVYVSVNGVRYNQVTPETEGITAVESTSRIFFIEEIRNNQHRVVFGNGVVGRQLEAGEEVLVTYLVTNGPDGNGVKLFTSSNPQIDDIVVVDIASGGDTPESIREIKDNAPHWYQSQYRAVTVNDYAAVVKKKFSDIQSIDVYGGEEVGQPGKVFIAIKPRSGVRLTDAVKDTITNDVLSNSNIVTIRPVVVDPQVLRVVVRTVLTYDDALLASNPATLRAKVFALFNNFNNTYIGEFLEDFRESNLSREIAALDQSIVGSNSRISIRFDNEVSSVNRLASYGWSFENAIYHPNDGFNAENGGVLSTNRFRRKGQTIYSGFDDDGRGNVRLFDWAGENANEKLYIINQAGTIDYATGDIEIEDIEFEPGVVQFTVEPESFDVLAARGTILEIAVDESVVDVIEKSEIAIAKTLSKTRSL